MVGKGCYFIRFINKVVKAAKIVNAYKVVSLPIHLSTGRGFITTASSGFGVGRNGTRIEV